VYQRCLPLSVCGAGGAYHGPSGSGATTKLCVNELLGLGMNRSTRRLALGERAEYRRERLLDALRRVGVFCQSESKVSTTSAVTVSRVVSQRIDVQGFLADPAAGSSFAVAMPARTDADASGGNQATRGNGVARADRDLFAVVRAMTPAGSVRPPAGSAGSAECRHRWAQARRRSGAERTGCRSPTNRPPCDSHNGPGSTGHDGPVSLAGERMLEDFVSACEGEADTVSLTDTSTSSGSMRCDLTTSYASPLLPPHRVDDVHDEGIRTEALHAIALTGGQSSRSVRGRDGVAHGTSMPAG